MASKVTGWNNNQQNCTEPLSLSSGVNISALTSELSMHHVQGVKVITPSNSSSFLKKLHLTSPHHTSCAKMRGLLMYSVCKCVKPCGECRV